MSASDYAPTSVSFDARNSIEHYGTPATALFNVRADLGWTADAEEIEKLAAWLDDELGHDWAREMAQDLRDGLVLAQRAARWHFAHDDELVVP